MMCGTITDDRMQMGEGDHCLPDNNTFCVGDDRE